MTQTTRYFINIYNYELALITTMRLSKQEYLKQRDYLNKQVVETENEDEDYNKITLNIITKEFGSHTITTHRFTNCCCVVELSEHRCKQGYYFKKGYNV